MPSEKTDAIVLRTVDFSESSLVVTLYTRDFGKVGALAKGARRLKGPFESALDLLALCRILFLRKSSESLDLLTEAKLMRRFRPAGGDLSGLYGGYYVAELLEALTHDYAHSPELFDLAEQTLGELAEGKEVGKCVARFELSLLRLLGLLPVLDRCTECGEPIRSAGRVMFAHLDGGVICSRCRVGKNQIASVSADVLEAMRKLADPDDRLWRSFQIDSRAGGQLRGLLNHYFAHLLGRKPRMQRYLI